MKQALAACLLRLSVLPDDVRADVLAQMQAALDVIESDRPEDEREGLRLESLTFVASNRADVRM